jgi:flagellar assembly protein FliH
MLARECGTALAVAALAQHAAVAKARSMSTGFISPPQVLRGMPTAAKPLRLQTRRTPPAAATAGPLESELRQECERVLQDARERGLRSGREEGLRQGRSEAAVQARAALDQAVEQAVEQARQRLDAEHARVRDFAAAIGAAVDEALEQAREELIALAFETICRIVGEHAVQPETVRSQLASLLQRHGMRERLVLHVHPQDGQLLAQLAPEVAWVADPEVRLGGCLLRSPAGGLDARLETVLSACRDALLDARSRNAAASQGHCG